MSTLRWRNSPRPRRRSAGRNPSVLAPADNRPYSRLVRFEWDPRKAAANLVAHDVSFAEAVTVLDDDFGLTREDEDTCAEKRLVTLGLSDSGTLLVVVYTYREPDSIRIISAWKANRRQRLLYEEGRS